MFVDCIFNKLNSKDFLVTPHTHQKYLFFFDFQFQSNSVLQGNGNGVEACECPTQGMKA